MATSRSTGIGIARGPPEKGFRDLIEDAVGRSTAAIVAALLNQEPPKINVLRR